MNHFNVSMWKCGLRIVGFVALITGSLLVAGTILIAAECLGILEEFVDKRIENE